MPINVFDYRISAYFNRYCRRSELFDKTIAFVSDNHLLKGGVIMILIWIIWFSTKGDHARKRLQVISTMLGSFISIFVARELPHLLPYRARPILNPENHFVEPFGLNRATFDNLSSFPSDHCTLFFALATGIFLISRRLGIFAYLYVLLVIAFPRVYLALHYATDIFAGALVGVLIVLACCTDWFKTRISAPILNWSITHPAIFYGLFFFISFEISEMFTSVRSLITFIFHPFS